jgi:hypothetical protein
MALYKSDQATGRRTVATPFQAGVAGIRFEYIIEANLNAGDVIYMGDFPANKLTATDLILISDDLDSSGSPTITLSAGVLSADKSAMGAGANDTWISAATVGQTGGVARSSTAAPYLSGPQEFTPRPIGIVVGTGAATPAMVGKKLVLIVNAAT